MPYENFEIYIRDKINELEVRKKKIYDEAIDRVYNVNLEIHKLKISLNSYLETIGKEPE